MLHRRCLAASGVVLLACTARAGVVYVDDDAAPGGDGLAWNTAYRYLQDALAGAVPGDEIRIAQGVYRPDRDEAGLVVPGDRLATFQLISGVSLLGGFAGIGAPDSDARDVTLYETVLTGDLMGDDGPDFLNNGENSYHVVTGTLADETAVLDGLTVTAGNANGTGLFENDGGGMSCATGSPTVNGCLFRENSAFTHGGGVHYSGVSSSVQVFNTTFEGNRTETGTGGGMSNWVVGAALVQDCLFVNNAAGFDGGGVYQFTSTQADSSSYRNCEFHENTAFYRGGGAYFSGSQTIISGCTFVENAAFGGGGLYAVSSCTLIGSAFVDNSAVQALGSWADGGGNSFTPPACDPDAGSSVSVPSDYPSIQAAVDAVCDGATITVSPGVYNESVNMAGKAVVLRSSGGPDVTTIDSQAADRAVIAANFEQAATRIEGFTITGGGMLAWTSSAVTVVDCRFIGNSNEQGGAVYAFIASPNLINCELTDNTADEGGAVYVSTLSAPAFTNCTVANNAALTSGGGIWAYSASPLFRNCIIRNNTTDQILHTGLGSADVEYSNVEGGWPGTGNIDADPLFVDPGNGDFRLSPDSPCIDAGDNTAVPEDITTDLDGNPRFLEIPETPDTGNGAVPIVDMGALESLGGGCLAVTSEDVVCHAGDTTFTANVEGLNACTGGTTQVSFTGGGGAPGEDLCFTALIDDGGFCCSTELCVTIPDCTPVPESSDLDGDGVVGIVDFLALLDAWGPCPDCGDCPADFDGDCSVGIADLLILLAAWSYPS